MTVTKVRNGIYRVMPEKGKYLVNRDAKTVVTKPFHTYVHSEAEASAWEDVTGEELRALLAKWGDSAKRVSVLSKRA
jgi:hypothetical protein